MENLIKKDIGIYGHAELLHRREYSSRELVGAYLGFIKENDAELGAYITVCEEEALAAAELIDKRRINGEELSLLAGIPFALKDNICVKGIRTTCASRMLENYVPSYTATAARRLLSNGAVLLGKTNMDEFSMGSSTENSAFFETKNPISPSRTPGGSSGGSAAAVASGEAVFALGSDTGGSVRQPAAFCGLVGMCPTYSRVSRYGLVAFASSLDRIGILTKSSRDSALVLSAISGYDPLDATSANLPSFSAQSAQGAVFGLRIGVISELLTDGASESVRNAVISVASLYRSLGAEVGEVSVPSLKSALSAYYIISSAEASSNLSRFDGVRYGRRAESYDGIDELYLNSRSEGFGAEVKRRIMLGNFVLSRGMFDGYYKKALVSRESIRADFERVLEKFDILLAPTSPTVAFERGKKRNAPTDIYYSDVCTVPSSLAGLPAVSLPFGKDENGLPVGVQLIGRAFEEALLYCAGIALEEGAYEADK